MGIEDVIRAWKADEAIQDESIPVNPVGLEMSEQELKMAVGGMVPPSGCIRATDGCNSPTYLA